jgi:hypothetical protein
VNVLQSLVGLLELKGLARPVRCGLAVGEVHAWTYTPRGWRVKRYRLGPEDFFEGQ